MANSQVSTDATTQPQNAPRDSKDGRPTGKYDQRQTSLVSIERHWDMETDIPWSQFDPAKVNPEILKIAKAASLVEYNARDYATYLCNVFHDDPEFQEDAKAWAYEEVQHGESLGRWCEYADPNWDHNEHFYRFVEGFRPDIEATESIRGSRSGEMVARCMVEIGTSSYYGSLGTATDEPVLKEICKRICADELRHYKMFYSHMKRYLEREHPSKWSRFRIALGRAVETEDDELSYAYYAANAPVEAEYSRTTYNQAYMRRAFAYYQPKQIERAVSMTWKASGFNPQSKISDAAAWLAWKFVCHRARSLARKGA